MTRKVFLSFDVEEFDMPLEYGFPISTEDQMYIGKNGLEALKPILEDKNIIVTNFVTAHFAETYPQEIKQISERHEIASHTYYHSQFEIFHLESSRLKLESITQKKVSGLRMPRMKIISSRSILDAGFAYDASIHPTWLPGRYNNLHYPRTAYNDEGLLRIPASVGPIFRIPLFWLSFKNFPFSLYKSLALSTLKQNGYLVLYFHPWEFVDIAAFGLPLYTRRLAGEALLERLNDLIGFLRHFAEFGPMSEAVN